MILWETLRLALRALVRNKMRSFLTMLGVIIGVGAVIAMVAIGEGAQKRVEEAFSSLGSNLIIVLPGSVTTSGARGGFSSAYTLMWDDLDAIRTEVPEVRAASPQTRSTQQVMSEVGNWGTSVFGVSPEYFDIRSWGMQYGRVFTHAEMDAGAKVAVVGQTVVDKLYGSGVDITGTTLRIRNVPFEVVGVMARKGQSAMGQDYDDAVLIPVTTYVRRVAGNTSRKALPGNIMVGATSQDATARVERQIKAMLRDRHRLIPGQEDDFFVRNLSEMATAQQEGTKTMTALLAAVALVSLLIGGIGIMNIMLVSVTERTREIGIRMAVGGKPRHILSQFLVEALTLSSLGGLVGVGVGIYAADRLSKAFDWPLLLRMDVILLALAFSALVGVVFGMYPARKASRMDPIEALRFE